MAEQLEDLAARIGLLEAAPPRRERLAIAVLDLLKEGPLRREADRLSLSGETRVDLCCHLLGSIRFAREQARLNEDVRALRRGEIERMDVGTLVQAVSFLGWLAKNPAMRPHHRQREDVHVRRGFVMHVAHVLATYGITLSSYAGGEGQGNRDSEPFEPGPWAHVVRQLAPWAGVELPKTERPLRALLADLQKRARLSRPRAGRKPKSA